MVPGSRRSASVSKPSKKNGASGQLTAKQLLRAAPSEKLAAFIPPALATRVDSAPTGDSWVHEIKFDGYRVLARKEGKKVNLLSRNNLEWTSKADVIAQEIALCPVKSVLLDGELVVFDAKGVSHFQSLQNDAKLSGQNLRYVVFDVLHYEGRNVRSLNVLERKVILAEFFRRCRSKRVLQSPFSVGDGRAAYQKAAKDGLEGIISKRIESRYQSKRTKDWLKVKCDNREEFIICGMTRYSAGGNKLGALLLCTVDDNGNHRYAGKVGTGYSEKIRKDLYARLIKLKVKTPPVKERPRMPNEIIWVKPKLVAQIAFREFTSEHLIRQGVYQGLREDLDPKQVHGEPIHKVPKK